MTAMGGDRGEKRRGGRLYKFVGALVVVLVIAIALVPLWLGGEKPRSRVVEVHPEVLQEQPLPPASTDAPRAGAKEGSSEAQEEPAAEDGGAHQWWRQERDPAKGTPQSAPSRAGERGSEGTSQEQDGSLSGEEGARAAGSAEEGPTPRKAAEPEAEPPPKAAASETGGGSPQAPEEEPRGATGRTDQVKQGPESPGPAPEAAYWTVMVGSFLNPDNARRLRDELRDKGFEVELVVARVEGKRWNRVLAGRSEHRAGAQALVPQLKKAGYRDLLVMKAQ